MSYYDNNSESIIHAQGYQSNSQFTQFAYLLY